MTSLLLFPTSALRADDALRAATETALLPFLGEAMSIPYRNVRGAGKRDQRTAFVTSSTPKVHRAKSGRRMVIPSRTRTNSSPQAACQMTLLRGNHPETHAQVPGTPGTSPCLGQKETKASEPESGVERIAGEFHATKVFLLIYKQAPKDLRSVISTVFHRITRWRACHARAGPDTPPCLTF